MKEINLSTCRAVFGFCAHVKNPEHFGSKPQSNQPEQPPAVTTALLILTVKDTTLYMAVEIGGHRL